MTFHDIGNISLNISLILYLIWFIPQLVMSYRKRSVEGLSLLMHMVLILGYISDVAYGWGLNMPIQYKLVTLSGFFSVGFEHYQIWRYGVFSRREKIRLLLITGCMLLLLMAIISDAVFFTHSREFYNTIGFFSFLCWMFFIFPQIVKNYQLQSTKGFSQLSLILIICCGICDICSAFTLDWAWPSKLNAVIGLVPKFLLLYQYHWYQSVPDHTRTKAPIVPIKAS